ncbi:hypothetical protein K7X08_033898 [Anisodus acutangulus]|uniref:Uncharacterized protein n=1 Tax=Anisodus acutangulus TaxID=402998 RepID=A0A9Q1M517_9SOLA|nr:hypothetical protein K7X08_033898 [Anisodus acutangulus]
MSVGLGLQRSFLYVESRINNSGTNTQLYHAHEKLNFLESNPAPVIDVCLPAPTFVHVAHDGSHDTCANLLHPHIGEEENAPLHSFKRDDDADVIFEYISSETSELHHSQGNIGPPGDSSHADSGGDSQSSQSNLTKSGRTVKPHIWHTDHVVQKRGVSVIPRTFRL